MFRKLHNLYRWPSFWIVAFILVAAVVSNLATGQTDREPPSSEPTQAKLMREGTRIESLHTQCRNVGDRLVVEIAEDTRPLEALENLASQRILQAVSDEASSNGWIVNGQITEFQGRNYILLDKVTRAPKE